MNCDGLYADIVHINASGNQTFEDHDTFEILIEAYNNYKSSKVRNLDIGNWDFYYDKRWIDGAVKSAPYHPLQVVQIFFDTATYDEIERDEKVALKATKCSLPIMHQSNITRDHDCLCVV